MNVLFALLLSAQDPNLKDLPDNTWVKLPTPAVHSMVRAGSPWMPYAPDADVAFLWGAGHTQPQNDLWSYSLARNEWKELLRTEPSAAQDAGVLKEKDGVIMTREERPLSAHQWGQMDYDPDRRLLWYYPALLWQGVYDHRTQATVTREGPPRTDLKGPTLWTYDLKTNKWSWVHTEDPSGVCSTYNALCGTFRYFPPLKKFVMIMGMRGDDNVFRLFDPDTLRWEPLKVTGPKIHAWNISPMVYDSKRKLFILNSTRRANGTVLLDPVKKTVEEIVPADRTPFGNLDGNCGVHVYDSAAATMLTLYTKSNFKVYDGYKTFQQKGWPCDETSVWALDFDKKEWVLQPAPKNGVRPTRVNGGLNHAYYDPVRNVTFVYEGSYNGMDGETWAYRYRRN